MKIIVTIISTLLVTNSLSFSFCPFLQTKNKNQVSSKLMVWSQELFLFFVYSESHSTSEPNAIDFYEGIFLHAIPVRIIVP